jgi:hypothetical protein
MRVVVLALAIAGDLAAASAARAEYSCEQIRWAVQTFSRAQLEQMARTYHVNAAERAHARACLGDGPEHRASRRAGRHVRAHTAPPPRPAAPSLPAPRPVVWSAAAAPDREFPSPPKPPAGPPAQPASIQQEPTTMLTLLSRLSDFSLGMLAVAGGLAAWYVVRHGIAWTFTKVRNLWSAAKADIAAIHDRIAALDHGAGAHIAAVRDEIARLGTRLAKVEASLGIDPAAPAPAGPAQHQAAPAADGAPK